MKKIKLERTNEKMNKFAKKMLYLIIIIFILVIIILVGLIINQKSQLNKQEEEKEQLTSTELSNAYITTKDHLSELTNLKANLEPSFSFFDTNQGNITYTTPSDCDFVFAVINYTTAGVRDSSTLTISGLPNMEELSKKMNYNTDGNTSGSLVVYAKNVPSGTVVSFLTDRNRRLAGCYGFNISNEE
jgi:cytoskeletal protein RodZ